MPAFSYPKDVVRQLREAWGTFVPHEEDVPLLPDDETVQAILEVVYHASFTADERRASRFSVALCNPRDVRDPLVFQRPREFTVHEIMRLAPAGDIDDLAIGVSADRHDRVKTWGLAPDPHGAFPVLAAHAPGSIEVRRYHRTVFTLHHGSVSTSVAPTIYEGFLNDVFREATEALLEECGGIMRGGGINPEWLYSEPLFALLRAASQHGHGATLFLVPDTLAGSGQWRDLVRIKYACDDRSMWPALKRTILADYKDVDDSPESISIDGARQRVREWPGLIANLTRVDGGVLITDRLRIIGFGVEAIAPAAELKTVHVANSGERETIDEYGTRHRSAFRLCYKCPEAVAFICSQDGGIKCVRNVNGVVTLWK
jgi:hypothetical protein